MWYKGSEVVGLMEGGKNGEKKMNIGERVGGVGGGVEFKGVKERDLV